MTNENEYVQVYVAYDRPIIQDGLLGQLEWFWEMKAPKDKILVYDRHLTDEEQDAHKTFFLEKVQVVEKEELAAVLVDAERIFGNPSKDDPLLLGLYLMRISQQFKALVPVSHLMGRITDGERDAFLMKINALSCIPKGA